MDQAVTGRFIAQQRRQLGLTQRELADALFISDKTVSKWECGGGMPEVSLMLPLCTVLGISANELLSGRRLDGPAYREKAEENIMKLMKDNQESRKRLAMSVTVGSISIVAVLALVGAAAFIEMQVWARVSLIALAVAVIVAGIAVACVLDREAGSFECPHCKARFVPDMKDYVRGVHTILRRRLTCPECGETSMCRHRTDGPTVEDKQ